MSIGQRKYSKTTLLCFETCRTVWVFQDDPNHVCAKSTWKQKVTCFIEKIEHVATVPLEQRKTVNSELYIATCLLVVFQEIIKTNRRSQISHLDNASSRTSAQTTSFLSIQNIDFISHSLYASDLTPNDFLFLCVKNNLRGQCFFDTWKSGCCIQNVCSEDIAQWQKRFFNNYCFKRIDFNGNILEKIKWFSIIDILFCSSIPKKELTLSNAMAHGEEVNSTPFGYYIQLYLKHFSVDEFGPSRSYRELFPIFIISLHRIRNCKLQDIQEVPHEKFDYISGSTGSVLSTENFHYMSFAYLQNFPFSFKRYFLGSILLFYLVCIEN